MTAIITNVRDVNEKFHEETAVFGFFVVDGGKVEDVVGLGDVVVDFGLVVVGGVVVVGVSGVVVVGSVTVITVVAVLGVSVVVVVVSDGTDLVVGFGWLVVSGLVDLSIFLLFSSFTSLNLSLVT